jgi:hypothetical protein
LHERGAISLSLRDGDLAQGRPVRPLEGEKKTGRIADRDAGQNSFAEAISSP